MRLDAGDDVWPRSVAGVLVHNAKVIIMKTFLKTFVADQSGASAAEYALILAVVGAGIAVAAAALGTAISAKIDGYAQDIANS
jgi:pilus assembly protein Flp/PilA